jgi:peptidyl-prolyl cis-trans isomerase C
MMTPNSMKVVGLLLVSLLLWGCPGRESKVTKEEKAAVMGKAGSAKVAEGDRGKAVARVGERVITVGDITDEINEQNPYIRMRYSSLEQKKKFLANMIQFEVLAQEAKRKKLDRDPEVLRNYKKAMVNTLLTTLRDELVKMEDITDKDIKAYYEANSAIYQQEEMVRVSLVMTNKRNEAEDVISRARAKPEDSAAFAELVQAHSVHQASRAKAGDLDFFTNDPTKLPGPLVEAAFKIKKMWGLAGPVKTSLGWAVLMKTGYRKAQVRPLDREREQIKNRLYNERRSKAILDFVNALEKKANVKIDEKNLAKVKPTMEPVRPPAPKHQH